MRRLSAYERAFYAFSTYIVANAVLRIRIRGQLDLGAVRFAIRRNRELHPLTAIRVLPERRVTTEGVADVELRVVVDVDGGDSWRKEMGVELGRPFDWSTGPLVRNVLVRGDSPEVNDLLFVANHAIVDGISGFWLVRDFFEGVAAFDGAMGDAPANVAPEPLVQVGPVGVVSSASLPLGPLAQACRRAGVMLNCLVIGAFAAAYAEHFEHAAEVAISVPVNLRPYLGADVATTLGLYASITNIVIDPSRSTDLWELAHAAQDEIARIDVPALVAERAGLDAISEATPDDSEFVARILPPPHHLSVSNLGTLPPLDLGGLRIEALAAGACAPEECVISVVLFDDHLCLTMSSRFSDAEKTARAAKMLAAVSTRLNALPAAS
jgi:hypothetical protein